MWETFPLSFYVTDANIDTTAIDESKNKKNRTLIECPVWCEKRDLNPYGVNHTPLKRARLPVPPLSHIISRRSARDIVYHKGIILSISFLKNIYLFSFIFKKNDFTLLFSTS